MKFIPCDTFIAENLSFYEADDDPDDIIPSHNPNYSYSQKLNGEDDANDEPITDTPDPWVVSEELTESELNELFV